MNILRRMGLFGCPCGKHFDWAVFLPEALNVNRIAYLVQVLREKMRERWLKMGKIKTIFAINKEICCK